MLSKKQIRCLEYLVDEGLTQRQIADKLGISEKTIFIWRYRDNMFRDELNNRIQKFYQYLIPKTHITLTKLLNQNIGELKSYC